jgi:hypothetical protein
MPLPLLTLPHPPPLFLQRPLLPSGRPPRCELVMLNTQRRDHDDTVVLASTSVAKGMNTRSRCLCATVIDYQ